MIGGPRSYHSGVIPRVPVKGKRCEMLTCANEDRIGIFQQVRTFSLAEIV